MVAGGQGTSPSMTDGAGVTPLCAHYGDDASIDAHGKMAEQTQNTRAAKPMRSGFTAQEFLQAKRGRLGKKQYKIQSAAGVSAWLTPTGRPRTGVETLLEAAESGEMGRQNPLCAMEQPGAIAGLAGSGGRCREPHTGSEKQQSVRVTI